MLRALTLGVLLSAFLPACGYGDHHRGSDTYVGNPRTPGPECGGPLRTGVVDTDAVLDITAGDGVGVFVEYSKGGHWRITTACDTNASGFDCAFDAIVEVQGGGALLGVSPDGLESKDQLSVFGTNAAELVATTDVDFDGFFLDADPGAPITIDVNLDGACAASYVFWIGGGAVHEGAPSTPFEIDPSDP
jgi:hypothetical protein